MESVQTKKGEIEACLEAMVAEEDVRLIFAIESGSRAWGHPSPNSDYDVRFVYVRPLERYVSLSPYRDVIERPIEADIDLCGWDIKKALSLLMKPNPVLLEWLSSPVRYVWDDDICSRLKAFAARTAHSRACRYYYRLRAMQRRQHIAGRTTVNLKKYFYVLRPALALRFIRMHPDTIPPMNMHELMRGSDLDASHFAAIHELLQLKAQAPESGEGPRNALLDALIEAEINAAEPTDEPIPDLRAEADALFRSIVMGPSEHAT